MGNKAPTPVNTPSGTPRKGKMTDLSSPPASPASQNSSRKNSAATKNKMTNTMSISNDSSTGRGSNSVTNAVGRQSTRSKPHILGSPTANGGPVPANPTSSGKDTTNDFSNNNSNNNSYTGSSSLPDEPHSTKVFRKSLHMHRKASMDATVPTLMSSSSTLSSINSVNNNSNNANAYEESTIRDSHAAEMPVMEASAVAVDELMSDGEEGGGEQQFKDRSEKIVSTLPAADLDRKAFAALDTKAKNIEYAKKLREMEKKQKEEEDAKLDTTQIHRKQELDAELREHENAKKQHLNKLNSAFKTGNNLKAGPRPVSSRPKEIVNRNLIVGK